jgi:hypothetical protein
MKTKLLFLLLFSSTLIFAQENRHPNFEKRLDEIKAKKVAFITEKVGLTPEEAQAFWPIYNEKQQKKMDLNKESFKDRKDKKDKKENVDFQKLNEEKIDADIKSASLEKEYYAKYKKVISDEKIFKLYRAEKEFKLELLKSIEKGHSHDRDDRRDHKE